MHVTVYSSRFKTDECGNILPTEKEEYPRLVRTALNALKGFHDPKVEVCHLADLPVGVIWYFVVCMPPAAKVQHRSLVLAGLNQVFGAPNKSGEHGVGVRVEFAS